MIKDRVSHNPKVILIPVFVAVSSLLLVYFSLVYGWFGASDGVGANFCEAARDALVKQPSNSYSNFAFVIFGLLAAWQLYVGKFKKNRNALTASPFFSIFFCCVAILLGPGSMAMHASESHLGGYFDMLSMYLTCTLMFSYAILRFLKLGNIQFFITFLAVLAICHVFHFAAFEVPIIGFSGSLIFAIFIVSAMLIELWNKLKNKPIVSFKWAIFTSLTFLLAFAIWTTGWTDHPWCDPHSLLQAHAIWHILDGLSVYFLFRYYVSEHKTVA